MDTKPPSLAHALERIEFYLYSATSMVLVLSASGLLIFAIWEMFMKVSEGDFLRALLQLLDRTLLVLMLAEIIYTVRRIAQRQRMEVRPFFIVAVIAAIRRILIVTAESTRHVDLQDPVFQAAMGELALLSLMVLALAGAMRLMPDEMKEAS